MQFEVLQDANGKTSIVIHKLEGGHVAFRGNRELKNPPDIPEHVVSFWDQRTSAYVISQDREQGEAFARTHFSETLENC